MTAYRFVTLTCDSCGKVWDNGIIVTVAEARRKAARDGWGQPAKGRDQCGSCHTPGKGDQ